MLLDTIKYSGLFVKIKSLESNLLKYEDYCDLARQKNVQELGQKLFDKNNFKQYDKDVQEAIIGGRTSLEKSLVESMYMNFGKVFGFVRDVDSAKYLKILFLKHEVDIVKSLLRALFDKRDISDYTPKYNNSFLEKINIDIEKLVTSNNLDEFIANLKNTRFHSVLNNINTENPLLFDLETQLDFYCYRETWRFQNKYLKSNNKISQQRINGAEIDLHNIMHIYRFKKYYNIDESILFSYLIPINYKIKKPVIKNLINAKSEEEFRDVLATTNYKEVFEKYPLEDMQKAYYIYMTKIHNEEQRKNPYSLSSITTYFFKKGQEVRNLITLIECVRYGLNADESIAKLNIAAK